MEKMSGEATRDVPGPGREKPPLGSPPSAPFSEGQGATRPLSEPLGLFLHPQMALPSSLSHACLTPAGPDNCSGP